MEVELQRQKVEIKDTQRRHEIEMSWNRPIRDLVLKHLMKRTE